MVDERGVTLTLALPLTPPPTCCSGSRAPTTRPLTWGCRCRCRLTRVALALTLTLTLTLTLALTLALTVTLTTGRSPHPDPIASQAWRWRRCTARCMRRCAKGGASAK